MEEIGTVLDEERREIMLRRNLGLTKLYNLVHDARLAYDKDVERLRAIHVEIDDATVEAYGWGDIHLDHGFHSYRQTERWTVGAAARIEIVDRLLEENLRRAGSVDQARQNPLPGMRQEGGESLFD